MKTQVLVHGSEQKYGAKGGHDQLAVRDFGKADAFDAYDMTVVDLQSPQIWRYKGKNTEDIDIASDIRTIAAMMCESARCRFVVLLPQNTQFRYDYQYVDRGGKDYSKRKPIKDALGDLTRGIMPQLIRMTISVSFGHSQTAIAGRIYKADFSLNLAEMFVEHEPVHLSNAQTVTTVALDDRTWVSTLSITGVDDLTHFIQDLVRDSAHERRPEWLADIPVFDELVLREKRRQTIEQIQGLDETLECLDATLLEYENDKAILCQKGDLLAGNARHMLAEILGVDNEFEDKREEDYRIELDNSVLVIEIKGSTGVLKRQHVSRAFDHAQIVQDELDASDDGRTAKAILVFSEEIETMPAERHEYPSKQLEIAARTDVLVVPALLLLRLYEAGKMGSLDLGKFIDVLENDHGLIEYEKCFQDK